VLQWAVLNHGVFFDVIDGRIAIQEDFDVGIVRNYEQLVPLPFFRPFGNAFRRPLCKHFLTPRFVVECAPNRPFESVSNICLITTHFGIVGDPFRTKLHTGIVPLTTKLYFKPEFEVLEAFLGAKKFVVRNWLLKRASHNRPILNAKPLRIAFPFFLKTLSIEKGSEALFDWLGCITVIGIRCQMKDKE
jgi:hypothetical protein